VTYLGVPIPDLATKMQSGIQSALLENPGLNAIVLEYDGMSQFAVPALAAKGKIGKLAIATFNGTDFALKFIQQGKLGMDAGENLDWLGYADMDQAMRLLSGLPAVKSENTPLRVFDSSNVKDAGTPPRANAGYGNAYVSGYRKLWGLAG
jgi:ribose transport system substrate-binding protein